MDVEILLAASCGEAGMTIEKSVDLHPYAGIGTTHSGVLV